MSQKMLQGQAKAKKEENVRMLHFTFSFHERIISPSLIFYQRRCNFRVFSSNEDTDNNVLSLFKGKKDPEHFKGCVSKCSSCIASGNLLKNLTGRHKSSCLRVLDSNLPSLRACQEMSPGNSISG